MHGRRRVSPVMKDGEIPHNLINFTGQGINMMTDDWKFVIFFYYKSEIRKYYHIPGQGN